MFRSVKRVEASKRYETESGTIVDGLDHVEAVRAPSTFGREVRITIEEAR